MNRYVRVNIVFEFLGAKFCINFWGGLGPPGSPFPTLTRMATESLKEIFIKKNKTTL